MGGQARSGEVGADRHLGVVVAERGLVDSEGAQVEGHRLAVLVLVAEGVAQVDEILGHLGVLGAQRLLVDGEGRHVQRHLGGGRARSGEVGRGRARSGKVGRGQARSGELTCRHESPSSLAGATRRLPMGEAGSSMCE